LCEPDGGREAVTFPGGHARQPFENIGEVHGEVFLAVFILSPRTVVTTLYYFTSKAGRSTLHDEHHWQKFRFS